MKAYVRCADLEHALHAPLATTLSVICQVLPARVRPPFDRIAMLDRERTPGEHAFDRVELLDLLVVAHGLLCDPPPPIRKLRRIEIGPLPAADRVGVLRDWLAERVEVEVIYDLWRSTTHRPTIANHDVVRTTLGHRGRCLFVGWNPAQHELRRRAGAGGQRRFLARLGNAVDRERAAEPAAEVTLEDGLEVLVVPVDLDREG